MTSYFFDFIYVFVQNFGQVYSMGYSITINLVKFRMANESTFIYKIE